MHDRLLQHQDAILSVMAIGEPILRGGSARDAVAIGRCRWELVRAMTGYQMFKHREILDPIIAGGTPRHAGIARRLKDECHRLGDCFRAYVARWSARGVDDWDAYRTEALALIDSIRAHLVRERAAIAELLAPQSAVSAGVAGHGWRSRT